MAEAELPKPTFINGRYGNPWQSWKKPNFTAALKFMFGSKDESHVPSKQELEKTLPVQTLDQQKLSSPPEQGVQATWLGHASLLIQIEGLNILTDPVFSNRCGPTSWLGPKRYRPVPCTINELPDINAVVISHNHYDHLDYSSVNFLNARFGERLRWFVPVGLASWMNASGCKNVVELSWWEEAVLKNKEEKTVQFIFTPAQHWCKRTATDDNRVLWGSWCVIGDRSRFYFAGDTGYCEAFKLIGDLYGPFDLAAIPVGAYEPRWFMKSQHINVEEAVAVHCDIKAKKSIGIHWGTFKLSNEFYLAPKTQLSKFLEDRKIPLEDFFVINHGETRHVS